MAPRRARVALGFSVHTGWAAMVAASEAAAIVDRRRLEMIGKQDPVALRFVYHAGRELELDAAQRLIRESEKLAASHMKAALSAVIDELAAKGSEVVAGGIIVTRRPLAGKVADILKSHSLVHAAEGAHFRGAVRGACEALDVPVIDIGARELASRGATALGIAVGGVAKRLDEIGRAAGKPWAKDHKDAFLAALVALA